MFESIQPEKRGPGRTLLSLLISIAVHVTVILVLVILPLIYFNVLPQQEVLAFVMTEPPPPPPPPPPAPQFKPLKSLHQEVDIARFTAPTKIPKDIPPPTAEPLVVEESFPEADGVEGGVPGGVEGGVVGGVVSGVPGALLVPPSKLQPPPPAIKPKPQAPLYVSNLQQSKLLRMVQPAYPKLAREARVSGTVTLKIIVNEKGDVTDVKVLSGHPLLQEAAARAAWQWKYAPTVLDGRPIPVTSIVTVAFTLQ